MFAELIFIILAIFVLFLIDGFSTLFGLIACTLIIYFSFYNSCIVLNKRSIAHGVGKLWATISFCFRTKKKIYTIYERIFLSAKNAISPPSPSNNEFCGNELCLENEINTLVVNISQYYIQSWYGKISDNEEFVITLNGSIKHTLLSLCTSVTNVDKNKFSYNVMQVYLHFFYHFVEDQKKSNMSTIKKHKIKHWAMKDNVTEWCYLQSLVSALLDMFCPSDEEKTLHSKNSPLLHTIVVEILTQHIIQPLVKVLSDPSRLNLIFLKILINSVEKIENAVENSSNNVHQHQTSPTLLERHSLIKSSPIILLPNEDLFNDSAFECEMSSTSQVFPDIFYYNSSQQESLSDVSETLFTGGYNRTSGNVMSLSSSGPKSSSNTNIFDQQSSNARIQHNVMSDVTIKRSRSADYIRQIPQLKPLNEQNYNIVLHSEKNKMLVALKPDTNSSIEQAEEAIEVEVPILFTDVKITDTFQENEDGLPYTRYCIQYTGVFHDTRHTSNVPQYVQQVVSIRRRFKEFVALQSSLEDNPSLKSYLKAIKAPSKWLLPFSNLDKKHIAGRKVFLENYLKQLCSISPIAHSSELQEFLAYGKDTNLFARKNPEISVPRIDKILVRGVKGAFDMIKTALPNSPLDDENLSFIPRSNFENANPFVKFQEHLLDYSNRDPEIKEHIANFMENSAFKDSKSKEETFKRISLLRSMQTFEATEHCYCSAFSERNILQEKFPFGSTVLELIALCLELNESNLGEFFTIIKLLFAPCVEECFVNKLDDISEDYLSNLLHMMHKYLWPDERSINDQSTIQGNQIILDKIKQHIEAKISSSFLNMNSVVKQCAVEKVNLFLSSFQQQEINKSLLFHIFDVIIEATCV